MIFSVIVPFLNEELRIEQCIQALLNQTFDKRSYEIIFIDNGSTDRSVEIVRKYAGINLLNEPQRDPYLARNRGINAAQGRYLAFTDADCFVDADWLTQFHQGLQDADIVLGRLLYPSPTPAFLRAYEHYYHTKIVYLTKQKLNEYYFGHAGNMAVRASVFEEIGPFPNMPVVGDTEIIHRLLEHNPQAVISYRAEAQVVHAEVRHFHQCLYKLFECGQYSETCQRYSSYRPLGYNERLQVIKTSISGCPQDSGRIPILAATLLMGLVSFEAGRCLRRMQLLCSRQ